MVMDFTRLIVMCTCDLMFRNKILNIVLDSFTIAVEHAFNQDSDWLSLSWSVMERRVEIPYKFVESSLDSGFLRANMQLKRPDTNKIINSMDSRSNPVGYTTRNFTGCRPLVGFESDSHFSSLTGSCRSITRKCNLWNRFSVNALKRLATLKFFRGCAPLLAYIDRIRRYLYKF